MYKNKRKLSLIFFTTAFTMAIFLFSIGKSALDSEILKFKRYNPDNNKILFFQEHKGYDFDDFVKSIDESKVSVMLSTFDRDSSAMVQTYLKMDGVFYREDIKFGRYFTKEEFLENNNEAVYTGAVNDKVIEISNFNNKTGNLNKIKLEKVGTTYERTPKIWVTLPLFKTYIGELALNSQYIILSGEDDELEKAIDKIKMDLKEKDSLNKLSEQSYMPYDIQSDQGRLNAIFILVLLITLINSIGIASMLVNERKKEIIIRKITGATNFDLSKIFFGELFVIGSIALLLALGIQYVLTIITDGYLLNINIEMSLGNILFSILASLGITLILTIPFIYYLSKIQPIDVLRGEG